MATWLNPGEEFLEPVDLPVCRGGWRHARTEDLDSFHPEPVPCRNLGVRIVADDKDLRGGEVELCENLMKPSLFANSVVFVNGINEHACKSLTDTQGIDL